MRRHTQFESLLAFHFCQFYDIFLGFVPKKRKRKENRKNWEKASLFSSPLHSSACTLSAMSVTSAVAVNCTHCDRNDSVSLSVCVYVWDSIT